MVLNSDTSFLSFPLSSYPVFLVMGKRNFSYGLCFYDIIPFIFVELIKGDVNEPNYYKGNV